MYKLNNASTSITRLSDNASIPADPANTDYANYLVWLDEGNTPQEADPIIIPIPTTVSMAQAQLALFAAGHLDEIEAAVVNMPREAQILWKKANTVQRGDPLVAQLAAFLNLDEAALDALFLAASKL